MTIEKQQNGTRDEFEAVMSHNQDVNFLLPAPVM